MDVSDDSSLSDISFASVKDSKVPKVRRIITRNSGPGPRNLWCWLDGPSRLTLTSQHASGCVSQRKRLAKDKQDNVPLSRTFMMLGTVRFSHDMSSPEIVEIRHGSADDQFVSPSLSIPLNRRLCQVFRVPQSRASTGVLDAKKKEDCKQKRDDIRRNISKELSSVPSSALINP